jgi:WASH complex subunit strumpellin
LTHKISVYTDGILTLDKTLMGLIELDPKEILVDGMRKELVNTIATILHETFIFKSPGSKEELYKSFESLKAKFFGMKKSFEYIQDFLNISGEQIWREEITRIFKVNLDKEALMLINKKYDYQEAESGIPIPHFEPVDSDPSPSFFGRILNQILSCTKCEKAFYIDSLLNFYDQSGDEVFGMKAIVHLEKDMGTSFLQCLETLISYRLVNNMKKLARDYGISFGSASITESMRKTLGGKDEGFL